MTTCLLCRYGEEGGLKMPEGGAKYTWVLDPIDGTKSFITGLCFCFWVMANLLENCATIILLSAFSICSSRDCKRAVHVWRTQSSITFTM